MTDSANSEKESAQTKQLFSTTKFEKKGWLKKKTSESAVGYDLERIHSDSLFNVPIRLGSPDVKKIAEILMSSRGYQMQQAIFSEHLSPGAISYVPADNTHDVFEKILKWDKPSSANSLFLEGLVLGSQEGHEVALFVSGKVSASSEKDFQEVMKATEEFILNVAA